MKACTVEAYRHCPGQAHGLQVYTFDHDCLLCHLLLSDLDVNLLRVTYVSASYTRLRLDGDSLQAQLQDDQAF